MELVQKGFGPAAGLPLGSLLLHKVVLQCEKVTQNLLIYLSLLKKGKRICLCPKDRMVYPFLEEVMKAPISRTSLLTGNPEGNQVPICIEQESHILESGQIEDILLQASSIDTCR